MPKRKCSSIVVSFGQNLIYYRKKCGFTQQQVADILNLNRTTYTKYETSVSEPSLEILLKLADLYGVKPNDLLSLEPNKMVSDPVVGPLTEREKVLINDYRFLSSEGKEDLLAYLKKLIKEKKKN